MGAAAEGEGHEEEHPEQHPSPLCWHLGLTNRKKRSGEAIATGMPFAGWAQPWAWLHASLVLVFWKLSGRKKNPDTPGFKFCLCQSQALTSFSPSVKWP